MQFVGKTRNADEPSLSPLDHSRQNERRPNRDPSARSGLGASATVKSVAETDCPRKTVCISIRLNRDNRPRNLRR
jgi:hypothetical protein